MMKLLKLLLTVPLTAFAMPVVAGTLENVKAAGFVKCGVSTGVPGFSAPDEKGEWSGLDVDLCRAIAAAIFDDPKAVKFAPLSAKERFTAIQSGEVDILQYNTTWSLGRDTALGLNFRAVNYYDGQGFMINSRKLPAVKSARQLTGASVCVQTGTTSELNVADYFKANGMEYNPVVFEKLEEIRSAYDAGRCDVVTIDQSALYSVRLTLANPAEHLVLPEVISKEPLGSAVRQGDDKWFDVVSWAHYAMVTAEELGITQANVGDMKVNGSPEVKRVLGQEAGSQLGADLGLDREWVARIVGHVGNYGEVFERDLGAGSPLKIARGINALWVNGGLQYAPPLR